jgi:hypothetical protein
MELDQKIRYALFALAAASVILAGLGFHPGVHLRVLDVGGGNDGL